MAKPVKRALRKRKCRCKCHVRQSVEMRRRGQQIGKNDTLSPTPMPHSQGAVMKVKIKKK